MKAGYMATLLMHARRYAHVSTSYTIKQVCCSYNSTGANVDTPMYLFQALHSIKATQHMHLNSFHSANRPAILCMTSCGDSERNTFNATWFLCD